MSRSGPAGAPRLGVLDFNPIQYHVPLYRRLAARAHVQLDVLYLYDRGLQPVVDPGFGVPVAWNIDLLSGYRQQFLTGPAWSRSRQLIRWLRRQDAVVIYGHSNPWMLTAAAACRVGRIPYLLRGDSGPDGRSGGARRAARQAVARAVVSGSAGGLAAGHRNAQFYARFGARQIIPAPYSVDNERFAGPPATDRAELMARWGLDSQRPLIVFCGKLWADKRPLDLAAAADRISEAAAVLFVGDGQLADQLRARLVPGRGAVTGFVNQAELPSYYHAADVLVLPSQHEPWGLVVNEAMAAGVLPVVSDRVGCAPDLVQGLGEVYPCGDVDALTGALRRALIRVGDPQTADRVRQRVSRYAVDATAAGFEQGAIAVSRPDSLAGQSNRSSARSA